MKWIYKVEKFVESPLAYRSSETLEERLNFLANDGWEVLNVFIESSTSRNTGENHGHSRETRTVYRIILKRPNLE